MPQGRTGRVFASTTSGLNNRLLKHTMEAKVKEPMPIEARHEYGKAQNSDAGMAFLTEARESLTSSVDKIVHCLGQLEDQDMRWRPHEGHNSIQNILLHLCGNMRQWIIHGVGGAPDVRNRPREFAERTPIPKPELQQMLEGTVREALQVLSAFPRERLLDSRRIQGFDTYVLAAIFDSVAHFVGHTHQIVYITRCLVGDGYRFQFVPASPEQGAPV